MNRLVCEMDVKVEESEWRRGDSNTSLLTDADDECWKRRAQTNLRLPSRPTVASLDYIPSSHQLESTNTASSVPVKHRCIARNHKMVCKNMLTSNLAIADWISLNP